MQAASGGGVFGDRLKSSLSTASSGTGGGRKQLPSLPAEGTRPPSSASQSSAGSRTAAIGASTSSVDGSSFVMGRLPPSYAPFIQEYAIFAEYMSLQKQRLPGIYVIPSANSPLVWFGVLFIRQGFYQGGIFRFTINIPSTFPDSDCPSFAFDYPVFHPLIHPVSGELDIKRAFPTWRHNINHIWQVLLHARRVFYKIDSSSPSNVEAGRLFDQDIEGFRNRVTDSLHRCRERLNDPRYPDDAHAIRFSNLQTEKFSELKSNMITPKQSSESPSGRCRTTGLSWVKNGTLDAFSKEDA